MAVVRQPIADERHGVVGYELLFGDNEGRRLDPARDPKATSALLVDAFGDIGLDTLAGRHPAWISIARNFLVEIGPPPVRPDRAVLQIAAYPAQSDLLGVLQRLGRSGYTIALDDYDGRPDIEDLLAVCSIVKVNVAGLSRRELAKAIALPKMHGALLVATGVTDAAEFESCRALGFSYFQGEFFAKPRVIRHRGVGTGGLASLRAMGELCAPTTGFDDLERIISSDVGLSAEAPALRQLGVLRAAADDGSVREALAPPRRPHRPPLGDGRWPCPPSRRAARARRDRPPPRPHVRDARRQRAARGARDPLHDRPLLRRRRPLAAPMEEVLDSLPFPARGRAGAGSARPADRCARRAPPPARPPGQSRGAAGGPDAAGPARAAGAGGPAQRRRQVRRELGAHQARDRQRAAELQCRDQRPRAALVGQRRPRAGERRARGRAPARRMARQRAARAAPPAQPGQRAQARRADEHLRAGDRRAARRAGGRSDQPQQLRQPRPTPRGGGPPGGAAAQVAGGPTSLVHAGRVADRASRIYARTSQSRDVIVPNLAALDTSWTFAPLVLVALVAYLWVYGARWRSVAAHRGRAGGERLARRRLGGRRADAVHRADLAGRQPGRADGLVAHGPAPADRRPGADPADPRADEVDPAPGHPPHPPHRAGGRPVRAPDLRRRRLRAGDVVLAHPRALRRGARSTRRSTASST